METEGREFHKTDLSFLLNELKNNNILLNANELSIYKPSKIAALMPAKGEAAVEGKRGFRTGFGIGKKLEQFWKIGKDYIDFIQPKKGRRQIGARIRKSITEPLAKKLKKKVKFLSK